VPAPWDVTTSYRAGTSMGPQAVLEASVQLDFFYPGGPKLWESGAAMLPISKDHLRENNRLRPLAERVIRNLENGKKADAAALKTVNSACEKFHDSIFRETERWLKKGKKVGVLGGEHSVSFGFLKALSKAHKNFGVLQIDAHMDLRNAYEGFTHSHASIMHNALPFVSKLAQVGIRDFCDEEFERAKKSKKTEVFFDRDMKSQLYRGKTWDAICGDILKALPKMVYITVDIDGLNPSLCPNTGTPVPGGLEFEQLRFLIEKLKASGRQLVGFDLVEVAPGLPHEWDASVGARVLLMLCEACLVFGKTAS
jgi:agmatinase